MLLATLLVRLPGAVFYPLLTTYNTYHHSSHFYTAAVELGRATKKVPLTLEGRKEVAETVSIKYHSLACYPRRGPRHFSSIAGHVRVLILPCKPLGSGDANTFPLTYKTIVKLF